MAVGGDLVLRRLGADQGGARGGDVAKHFLFLRGVALHRLDEVGDKVGAALQNHVHLRPGSVNRFALAHHLVTMADKGAADPDDQQHDHNQNDQSFFHGSLSFMISVITHC